VDGPSWLNQELVSVDKKDGVKVGKGATEKVPKKINKEKKGNKRSEKQEKRKRGDEGRAIETLATDDSNKRVKFQ
jgi:hypothetical protein